MSVKIAGYTVERFHIVMLMTLEKEQKKQVSHDGLIHFKLITQL